MESEVPPKENTYSRFLYDLAMELSSSECNHLAFLAGVSGSGDVCPGHRCCCSRQRGSLDLLRRLQQDKTFSEEDLSPLAVLLETMGRNDLADKCNTAEFKSSCCAVQETERNLQSLSVDFRPGQSGDERCRFVESCPLPVVQPSGDTLPHGHPSYQACSLASSTIVVSSSSITSDDSCPLAPHRTQGCPTFNVPTTSSSMTRSGPTGCVDVPLHICRRARFPLTRRSKGSTTPLPFSDTSGSLLSSEDYEIIETPPSPVSSHSSVSTRSSVRPSSLYSPDSSPSPDLSLSSPAQSPTMLQDYVQVQSPNFPIPRGHSVDLPSSSPATCTTRPRRWTWDLIPVTKQIRTTFSHSKSKIFQQLHDTCSSSCVPTFLWRMKRSDLLSRISKRRPKPMEEKFEAKTLADKDKFRLQFVLQLYPNGTDFDQDQYCTLKIDTHCTDNQHLSKQKLELQVEGVSDGCGIKKVKKLCTVGKPFIIREFLSHEVLRCIKAKHVEFELSVHLQYNLEGDESAYVFIGKDQVS